MIIEGQSAFIIHSRKYTDSRMLVELLTEHHGRVSCVFRNSRSKKSSNHLQAFTPLVVNWQGKTALKTLTMVESSAAPFRLSGTALYCGFYLNELIERTLVAEDSCVEIFQLYGDGLAQISRADVSREELEIYLRCFEMELLNQLGFGINFYEDIEHKPIVDSNACGYQYRVGVGFEKIYLSKKSRADCIPGAVLVDIREGNLARAASRKYAKSLCRKAIQSVLGDKPLKARDFFR